MLFSAQSLRRRVLSFAPKVEQLESRWVPYSVSGNAWPKPELVTLGFVPDGTVVGSNANGPITSNLFAAFDAKFTSSATWKNQIIKAAQQWAAQTNINFAVITDNGSEIGTGDYQQGDPNQADIRIGGYNFGTTALAQSFMPPAVNNFSVAGDLQFNTAQVWNIGATHDLYTVAMHEIGHSLGLNQSTTGTVMVTQYASAMSGLTSDDIAGIRNIYSAGADRSKDVYDQSTAGNNAAGSATTIAFTNSVAQMKNLDISTTTDVDFFKFKATATTTVKVSVQSAGLSLLAPALKIQNSAGTQMYVTSGAAGSTLTTTISVTKNSTYYIRVAGTSANAAGIGRYTLSLAVGSAALPAVVAPVTSVPRGDIGSGGGGSLRRMTNSLSMLPEPHAFGPSGFEDHDHDHDLAHDHDEHEHDHESASFPVTSFMNIFQTQKQSFVNPVRQRDFESFSVGSLPVRGFWFESLSTLQGVSNDWLTASVFGELEAEPAEPECEAWLEESDA